MKKLCKRMFLFLLKNYAYLFGKFGMIVPFPKVKIFKGDSANDQLADAFARLQARKALIITDRIIFDLGLHKNLVESLSRNNIDSCVFAQVEPDPDFSILEQGVRVAREQNIDSIVAIGGGSVMDAAKLINPAVKFNRSPRGMMGLFRVLRKAYPFACIPTTAGTGSEVTVAAVITDKKTETKKFCLSPAILPDFAVLDKNLLRTLPPFMVATSGLDALTHAFEAYMSRVASRETKENSLKAIILILDNLQSAYENPEDLIAKENMLLASHYAGLAFTRANVGWVHAIAHQFGGVYHLNHGYANAVILPHIMRFYERKILRSIRRLIIN